MIFIRPQRVYKPSSSSDGRLDNESILDPSSYGKYHIIAEATRGTVFNDEIGLLTFVAHIYNDNGEDITALLQEKGFAPVWKLDKATVASELLTDKGYTLKLTSRAMTNYFATLTLEARDTDILLSLVAPDLRQGIQRLIEEGAIPSTLLTHEHTIIHQLNLVQIADEKISESKKELLTKLAGKLSPEDLAKKLGDYATNTSVAQKLAGKLSPEDLAQKLQDYATNTSVNQKLAGKLSPEDLAKKLGEYATNSSVAQKLQEKQDKGDYATNTSVNQKLAGKLSPEDLAKKLGDYATITSVAQKLQEKQDKGDYATNSSVAQKLQEKQDKGDYATNLSVNQKLAGKLSPEDLAKKLGEYATNTSVAQKLQEKQDKGDYATNTSVAQKLQEKQDKGDYATNTSVAQKLQEKQDKGDYATNSSVAQKLAGKLSPEDLAQKLQDYATNTSVNQKLAGKLSPEDLAKKLGDYATNTSVAQKLAGKLSPEDLAKKLGEYATNTSVAQKLQEHAAMFDSFVADTALRFDQLTTDTAQQFDQITTDIQNQTEAQRAILAEQWRKTQKMHEDSERNIQAQYQTIAKNYLRIGALSTNNIRSNSSKNGGGRIMLSPSFSTIFIRRNNPTGICQFVVRVEQLVNAPLGSTWSFYNFPHSGASIYVAQPSSSLGYYAYMKSWDDRSSLGFVMEEGYKYEMTKTWNPLEFSIARIKLD